MHERHSYQFLSTDPGIYFGQFSLQQLDDVLERQRVFALPSLTG